MQITQTSIVTIARETDRPIGDIRFSAENGQSTGEDVEIQWENEIVLHTRFGDGQTTALLAKDGFKKVIEMGYFDAMLNAVVDADTDAVITRVRPFIGADEAMDIAEENDLYVHDDEDSAVGDLESKGMVLDVQGNTGAGNFHKADCLELVQQFTSKNGWDALYKIIEHLDPMKVQHPKQEPERTMVERYDLATEPLQEVAKAEIMRQITRLGGDIEIDEAEHGSYDEPFDGRYTPERIYMQDGVPMLQCCTETSRGGAYLYDLNEFLNVLALCYLADYLAEIKAK